MYNFLSKVFPASSWYYLGTMWVGLIIQWVGIGIDSRFTWSFGLGMWTISVVGWGVSLYREYYARRET